MKFRENTILTKWQNRSYAPYSRIFNVANLSFNTIRVHKILAKISDLQFKVEQTILVVYGRLP